MNGCLVDVFACQTTRDYFAGRTDKLDAVLDWAEAETEPIVSESDVAVGVFR